MNLKGKRAVKPFRSVLERRVRDSKASLRVFGSKGEWYLGVQVNDTIHRYSESFITQVTAIMAGYRKFNLKASQYKRKAA